MDRIRQHTILPYAIAMLSVGGALLARWPFAGLLGNKLPFITLFPAVLLSAYLGGYRGGLVATALGALGAIALFLELGPPFTSEHGNDLAGLVLFLLIGGFISGLFESLHRARARAVEAEAVHRAILASISEAVVVTDPRGVVTYLNDAARELTGWRGPAEGAPLGHVLPLGRPTDGTEPIPEKLPLRATLRAHDGREVPIEESAAPIRDQRGQTRGMVLVVRDIGQRLQFEQHQAESLRREATARAEVERERDLLRRVLDNAPLAVVLTEGPEHRITFLNPAASTMLGLSAPQVMGKKAEEIAPQAIETVTPLLDRVLQTGSAEAVEEVRVDLAIGDRYFQAAFAALPGPDGQVIGVIHMGVDLSARKRLEEELRHRADALAEVDRRKDEFLALLGHELRNPLAPIRYAVDLLALRPEDVSLVHRSRETINRQVTQLKRLVDELLDASRLTRGKVRLNRETLDLCELVREALGDYRPQVEAAGLHLTIELADRPLVVRGDSARLTQVLGNLLDNAIKHTPSGGQVTVRLHRDEGEALLQVTDSGVGARPDQLPRLWEAFAQGDEEMPRPQGGLGLGLTIVKGLIELHGGRVGATSEGPGRGATFSAWLPLVEPAPAPPLASLRSPAPLGRLRVLIIEDNVDAAVSLQLLLTIRGMEVEMAHTGPDGLQAAERFRPDAVVCDLGLPGLTGFEVARALRAGSPVAGARLVSLSGYGQQRDCEEALAAGFDVALVKPVEPEALMKALCPG